MNLQLSMDDEQVVYDIRWDIFNVEDRFQGPQVRASGDSQSAVFVDDLAFSSSPLPLAESTQPLAIVDAR